MLEHGSFKHAWFGQFLLQKHFVTHLKKSLYTKPYNSRAFLLSMFKATPIIHMLYCSVQKQVNRKVMDSQEVVEKKLM